LKQTWNWEAEFQVYFNKSIDPYFLFLLQKWLPIHSWYEFHQMYGTKYEDIIAIGSDIKLWMLQNILTWMHSVYK
jgi:hypothetical protein